MRTEQGFPKTILDAGNQLLIQGIHPKIAQELFGHSTLTTTLGLYAHVTDTMQNDAVSKLDSAFRSGIKTHSRNSGPKPG